MAKTKRRWIKSARLKKGALHRWAGVRVDKQFTPRELEALEDRARSDLKRAHEDDDKVAAGRSLHHLRMVLLAKKLRGYARRAKRKKGYGRKR